MKTTNKVLIRRVMTEVIDRKNAIALKRALEDALHYLGYVDGLNSEESIRLQSEIEKFLKAVKL